MRYTGTGSVFSCTRVTCLASGHCASVAPLVDLVHRCFRHRHIYRPKGTLRATNRAWWVSELRRNLARDLRNVRDLPSVECSWIVRWEREPSVARATAKQRTARLQRFGCSLVRKVT